MYRTSAKEKRNHRSVESLADEVSGRLYYMKGKAQSRWSSDPHKEVLRKRAKH